MEFQIFERSRNRFGVECRQHGEYRSTFWPPELTREAAERVVELCALGHRSPTWIRNTLRAEGHEVRPRPEITYRRGEGFFRNGVPISDEEARQCFEAMPIRWSVLAYEEINDIVRA